MKTLEFIRRRFKGSKKGDFISRPSLFIAHMLLPHFYSGPRIQSLPLPQFFVAAKDVQ
jgi:hypothetical protein